MSYQQVEPTDLVSILQLKAKETPDNLVYTFLENGGKSVTKINYRELDLRARAMASYLIEEGFSESRALLLYPSGMDFVLAFWACLYAKVIPVPAYPPHPSALQRNLSRLEKVIQDAEATLVLGNSLIIGMFESMKESQKVAIPMESNMASPSNDSDSYLSRLKWINTDTIGREWADSWVRPNIVPTDLAFLQYTSGSTGAPKGVMVSHHNLVANALPTIEAFELTSESCWACWLPLYHDMGLIGNIIFSAIAGCQVVYFSPSEFLQNPVLWLKVISEYQATIAAAPNFAYELCVQKVKEEDLAGLDLSSWVMALNAAEPIKAQTLRNFTKRFAACGFRADSHYGAYGLAESTVFVSGGIVAEPPVLRRCDKRELQQNKVVYLPSDSDSHDSVEVVGVGRGWKDQEIIIVDPATCLQCEDQIVGEVWTRGDSIPKGYWKKPEITEKVFRGHIADTGAGPYLRTGDLGFMEGSELFISGRIKDLIILRGRNIYPQDLEATASENQTALRPGCSAAFSFDDQGQDKVVLVAELRSSSIEPTEVAEIAAKIASDISLVHGIRLHQIEFIKPRTIAKTSSGKIQRHGCKQQFLSGKLASIAKWENPPIKTNGKEATPTALASTSVENGKQAVSASTLEALLIKHLSQAANIPIEEIDPHTSFAEYGLDSMDSVDVIKELESITDQELSLTLIWDYPTPVALAQQVAKLTAPEIPAPSQTETQEEDQPEEEIEDLLEKLFEELDSPHS